MWKALIKLVETWGYRCEHDYELVHTAEIFSDPTDTTPNSIQFLYRCTKCCESKTLNQ
jgi:hypothetical protein